MFSWLTINIWAPPQRYSDPWRGRRAMSDRHHSDSEMDVDQVGEYVGYDEERTYRENLWLNQRRLDITTLLTAPVIPPYPDSPIAPARDSAAPERTPGISTASQSVRQRRDRRSPVYFYDRDKPYYE
jgi:hypothetical protein